MPYLLLYIRRVSILIQEDIAKSSELFMFHRERIKKKLLGFVRNLRAFCRNPGAFRENLSAFWLKPGMILYFIRGGSPYKIG
jgi:hypothetical protein